MRSPLLPGALFAVALAGCHPTYLIGFEPPPDAGPVTCASLRIRCGLADDGNGGTLDCGPCAADGGPMVFPEAMGPEFQADQPVLYDDGDVKAEDVAFDGEVRLVAWLNPRGVWAVRFNRAGQRLDALPIALAPAELVFTEDLLSSNTRDRGASVQVVARDGGGFAVFWTSPSSLSGLLDRLSPALSTTTVSREGQPGKVEALTARSPARFEARPLGNDLFRVAGVLEPTAVRVQTVGLTSLLGNCAGNDGIRLTMPGSVVGRPAYERFGARHVVAAFVEEAGGANLLVKVLGGDEELYCVGSGTEVLRLPWNALGKTPDGFQGARWVGMAATADRLVVVWRDLDDDSTALWAASLREVEGTLVAAAPVRLLDESPPNGLDVVVRPAGAEVVVAVLGIANDAEPGNPVGWRLAPDSLAVTSVLQGSAAATSLRPRAVSDFTVDGTDVWGLLLVDNGLSRAGLARLGTTAPGVLLETDRMLPGGTNEQSVPRLACGASSCLLKWRDNRDSVPYPLDNEINSSRAVRVHKASGTVLDAHAFELAGAVAASDAGYFAVNPRCTEEGAGSLLEVRAIPESGPPAAVRQLPLPGLPCVSSLATKLARTQTGWLIAQLVHGPAQLRLFHLGDDGALRTLPAELPEDDVFSLMELVTLGKEVLFVLGSGGGALVTFRVDASGQVAPAIRILLSGDWRPELRAANAAGKAILVWTEWSPFTGADYQLRFLPLDPAGKPEGEPRTLTTERGEVSGLELLADERGAVLLHARRTFPTDKWELVFRRLNVSEGTLAAPRLVASDLSRQGQALAPAGSGRWLTGYVRGGRQQGVALPAPSAPGRLVGRFVYESLAP